MKKILITVILFFCWELNAQVALPTFQATHYVKSGLYSFSSHTFTNCGSTGKNGPTLANCKSSYDVSWEDNTNYFNVPNDAGIQYWTVPITGTYTIEAYGAQGGDNGGEGARMRGNFNLTQGDILKILVGQAGGTADNQHGSGGGGSFVATNDDTPLVVAGGGGGHGKSGLGSNADGATTTSGKGGSNGTAAQGGSGGGGGSAAGTSGAGGTRTQNGSNVTSSTWCSGGGGFYTHGGKYKTQTLLGGQSFVSGGVGGQKSNQTGNTDGGFGGGGGCGDRGSGGGGYSGGGGGTSNSYGGGGGGSYNSGSSQSNSAGVREGHGQVIITLN